MGNLEFNILKNKMEDVINKIISKNDFYDWLNENLEVSEYISLSKKYDYMKAFSIAFQYDILDDALNKEDIDVEYIYINYDMYELFRLLLKYTNINIIYQENTLENYDLIHISGLYSYIINICQNDFNDLKEKSERVLGINNLSIIKQLTDIFDNRESITEFKDATMKLEKVLKSKKVSENMRLLKEIELFNNPLLGEIIENRTKEMKGANAKK